MRVCCFVVADCGPLSIPVNGTKYGTAVVSVLGDVDMPAVTSFECDIGFDLIGSSERTCLSNGTWSGLQPVCNCK